MKTVFVTQRVDILHDRNERRDALDQRLCMFLSACGYLPIPIPNLLTIAENLATATNFQAIILSGGNNLGFMGGDAPERDEVEERLVQIALERRLPVVGICRGMQFLVHRDGGSLQIQAGHVASRHFVGGVIQREVNSYHNWVVRQCGQGWETLGMTEDGSIESARCVEQRLYGLMWHPEREKHFLESDIQLIQEFIGS